MVYLSRNGPRLLRQVGGRKHAGELDHEDEEDVNREPISSDEEVEKVVEREHVGGKKGVKGTRGAHSTKSAQGAARGGKMRAPVKGAFEKGRALKGKLEGEKENEKEEDEGFDFGMGSMPRRRKGVAKTFGKKVSSGFGAKRKADDGDEEERIHWGMASTPPKKQRTQNVHATVGRTTFGKGKTNPTPPSTLPNESDLSHLSALDSALSKDNALSSIIDVHDPYCDVSSDELPSPASNPPSKPISFPTTTAQDPLPTSLLSDVPDISDISDIPDIPDLPSLPNSPTPPQSPSSPPSNCPLCLDAIDPSDYATFYTTHPGPRTVRLQMLFCREHKRMGAQREYAAKGYPVIDWEILPSRVVRFRAEMVRVLRNEGEESAYRARFGGRLASGGAAWMPRRRVRRDGRGKRRGEREGEEEREEDASGEGDVEAEAEADQRKVEEEDDDEEDISLSTTRSMGYYGPRGKRLMMETLTSELASEIREVSVKDPVVGRSGFAMFLQAVVVPELVLLLVGEDFKVEREEAERIVEESWRVGARVNGEVEGEGGDVEEEDSGDEEEEEGVGEEY